MKFPSSSLRPSGWAKRLSFWAGIAVAAFLLLRNGDLAAAPADDLAAQVTIRRDTFGVPHILADSEEAAAFGHGYASAEDHLLTLARLFLQSRGEEALHFGPDAADGDLLIKQFRIHAVAEAGYAKSAPWVQQILDGYAAGYNRYVQKHRVQLPDWVQPITGINVLAHCRRVVVGVFALDPQLEKIGAQAMGFSARGSPIRKASNMWAVGKGRSASGKGILLANPQLPWEGYFLFYEAHITVPGKINMSGVGLLGMPCIVLGFNETLGWSHTVNDHDCDDLYELTLDPQNPEAYLYDGRSRPLRKEEIVVQVKTPAGLVARQHTVYHSHYGPVLKQVGKKAYALKSANLDEYRFVEQWNLMGKARTLDEFRSVLDMQALPVFNIAYADKEGNVFYLCNGRFPDRPVGYDWLGVVPGNTSATEWNRLLPQSRLPFLVNPRGGYAQNCNSAPWYTSLRAPIDRRRFPPWFSRNINGFRQQKSLQMIDADESISLEEVKRYKVDPKWVSAERFKGDLVKIATAGASSADFKEAAAVLSAWDNTGARDSQGALLFATIMRKYWDRGGATAVDWNEERPVSTPSGIGNKESARKCIADAVREMKKKYGALAVPWGDVHRLRRGKVDVPIGGVSEDVLGAFRNISYVEDKDGKFVAAGDDSYVLAVEFTSPPTAYSIVAYSQSGDPASPHHADQSALFADEKWKRAWFTEEEIARNLERSYHP